MSKRTFITIMVITIFSLGLMIGSNLGVNGYRASCETMGNVNGDKWLECKL